MQREVETVFSRDAPGNLEFLFVHGQPSKVRIAVELKGDTVSLLIVSPGSV